MDDIEKEYPKLTKAMLFEILDPTVLWQPGNKRSFSFRNWRLTFSREEDWCSPFVFGLTGYKINTKETWSRRYETAEQALLHILNGFNENVLKKNGYTFLSDVHDVDFRQ